MNNKTSRDPQKVRIKVVFGVCLCLLMEVMLLTLLLSFNRNKQSLAREGEQGTGTGTQSGDSSGVAGGESSAGGSLVNHKGSGDADTESAQSTDSDVVPDPSAAETVEQEAMQPVTTENEAPAITKKEREKTEAEVGFMLNPIQADSGAPPGVESDIQEGMFENRSAESRQKLAEKEGGSPESEAAVERGLIWLANHQSPEGSWSLHGFSRNADCNGSCSKPGTNSDAAGTALGLFPFLGAGYTHQSGKYRKVVNSALNWLIQDMNKDGSFNHLGSGNMYAHGQASIALCEAYAMTRDRKLRDPAIAAIGYIAKSQHDGGGWRYRPNSPGDTSVTGWQILALKSAQDAKLRIPRAVIPKTNTFLDSVQADKVGASYAYTPGGGGTIVMTAEGLLCRMYGGWNRERSGIQTGTQTLLENMPSRHRSFYYWYYATQVMHHFGGEPWEKWNLEMRDQLLATQSTEGHETGSWAPAGGHDTSGGRIYATSLALLTLEVYYRHKRLYESPR